MLKVYMVGLIYFDGCDQPVKRAWAPDGRDGEFIDGVRHDASLWIREDQLHHAAGWPPQTQSTRAFADVPFIEFRITDPAQLEFPDEGNPLSCDALDDVMPKLKKGKKKPGDDEYFEIDPATARTIARVEIRGGTLVPYDMGDERGKAAKFGLVEWTIENPSGLEITAGGGRTIALKPDVNAEVVFSNMHEIPVGATKDHLAGKKHIQLFKQLNPALADVTLVSHKPKGLSRLATDNDVLHYWEFVKYSDGDTPPCCAVFVRHH